MMLGFDPAGFRTHRVPGFDPGSSSDPDNRPRVKGGVGFRSHRVLGFDPDDCWSRVSIPTTPGFRSLMNRVRTLGGVDPAESWVSIPDFPSKLTSKLPSKVLSKLTSKLPVRSLVSLLVLLVRSLVSLLVNY